MTNYGTALRDMVSFSEFNRGQAGKIFNEVKTNGAKIVVKNNKPECVILSVDDYMKLTDELNDIRTLLLAAERMNEFDGNMKDTFTQEEVEKLLGLDSSDFDGVEIE